MTMAAKASMLECLYLLSFTCVCALRFVSDFWYIARIFTQANQAHHRRRYTLSVTDEKTAWTCHVDAANWFCNPATGCPPIHLTHTIGDAHDDIRDPPTASTNNQPCESCSKVLSVSPKIPMAHSRLLILFRRNRQLHTPQQTPQPLAHRTANTRIVWPNRAASVSRPIWCQLTSPRPLHARRLLEVKLPNAARSFRI